jgi:putative tricarboxylic transport membrane protein
MIFSVIGTYAGTNNIYDVWIMIGFGIVGYLMMKTNFSTAGLLLGLILGPIAEDGMRDLLIISHNSPITYILTRPIAMALVLSIAFIVYISFKPQPWQEK